MSESPLKNSKETKQTWNLQFHSHEVEEKYQKSKGTIQNTIFSLLFLTAFIICFLNILWHFAYKPSFKWEMAWPIIILALLPIGTFALCKLLPTSFREPLIIIFALFFILGTLEVDMNQPDDSIIKNNKYFMLGQKEILFMMIILSRVSWASCFVLVSITNMLWILRYNNHFVEGTVIIIYELLDSILKIIVLVFISFKLEKLHRLRLKDRINFEMANINFQELIKEEFPDSLIIVSGDRVIFSNKEAQRIFGKIGEEISLEVLKEITIETIDSKINCDERLMTNNNNQDKICLINTHVNAAVLNDSIYSLLFGNKELFEKADEHRNMLGRLYCVHKKGNTSINLEIRLKNIIWENNHALMILTSENSIYDKLKRSRDQGLYKDRILATVSHDLRTPLNGVIGLITLSLEEIADKHIRKNLTLALRSAKLLLYMINDILDFSQISNGKLRLNIETFDLWEALKDISKLIKFQAKQKGIEFITENLTGSIKINVLNDQNRLKQVLLNLLGNALKFTQKGHIKLTLEKMPAPNEQEDTIAKGFKISVEDTGLGIKKEDIPKLFKLFRRLENHEDLNKNGVGLGLAISQKLVKRLNNKVGKIMVNSIYGQGSCFYFPLISNQESIEPRWNSLPGLEEFSFEEDYCTKLEMVQRKIKSKNEEILSDYTGILEQKSKKIKVLVVDDDQLNIKVASSYLQKSGNYEFDVVFDGSRAIELLKSKATANYFYDIILMDCNMPIMDGFEATEIIRAMIKEKLLEDVDIIACTANASEADYQNCFRSGMTDYISKPFTRETLQNKIQKILEKRKTSIK